MNISQMPKLMRAANFRFNNFLVRKVFEFWGALFKIVVYAGLRAVIFLIFSLINCQFSSADSEALRPKSVSFADDSGYDIIVEIKGPIADLILNAASQIERKSDATKLYKKMLGASYGRFIVDGRVIFWQGANLYVRDGDHIRVFQSETMLSISKKWIALEKIDKVSVERLFSIENQGNADQATKTK